MKKLTAGIYFTMAGSWALALRSMDADIVWHYCIKEFHKVFSLNFPDVIMTDSLSDINGGLDLIVGSPPCIGMSTGNPKACVDHGANQETLNFAMVVDVLRPKGFVMEMVPMIVRPKFDELFREYIRVLQRHYNFECDVIDFSDYGVPARRKRFIIMGLRKDIKKSLSVPCIQTDTITIRKAFQGLPRWTEEKAIEAKMTRKFNPKWKGPWSTYLRKDNPFQLRWDGIAPCVTNIDTKYFKHPKFLEDDPRYHRLITYREAARLMEFPDEFEFTGGFNNMIKQISWGVTVKGIPYFIKEVVKAL